METVVVHKAQRERLLTLFRTPVRLQRFAGSASAIDPGPWAPSVSQPLCTLFLSILMPSFSCG